MRNVGVCPTTLHFPLHKLPRQETAVGSMTYIPVLCVSESGNSNAPAAYNSPVAYVYIIKLFPISIQSCL